MGMLQSLVFKNDLSERDFKKAGRFHPQSPFLPTEFYESPQYPDMDLRKEQLFDVCDDWPYVSLDARHKPSTFPKQSEVDNDSVGCGHDEHKVARVIQKSAGGSLVGVGINAGTGRVVIVCTKCHTMYEAEKASSCGMQSSSLSKP